MASNIPTSSPPPRRPQITLDHTSPVTCSCGGQVFRGDYFIVREASRLLTGETQDSVGPVQVVVCVKCEEILQKMLPPELRENKVEIVQK